MLKVNLYSLQEISSRKEEWNKRAISSNSISQTFDWALVHSTIRTRPLFLSISENNDWVATWLVFIHFSVLGRIIKIVSEPVINSSQNREEVYFMMENALEKLHPLKIDYLDFAHSRLTNKKILEHLKFTHIYKYNTYLVDLTKEIELIWKDIHKKHRNDIRYAQKIGVTIEETNNVKLFYDLSCETYARSNKIPTPLRLLSAYYNAFGPFKMARIFIAKYQNKPLAAAFMLCYGDKILYFKGATANQLIRGSGNLLHWHLIQLFKQEGYKIYDFGGVSLVDEDQKLRGIKLFKSRFGGEELFCYGGIKILNPFKEKVLNKIKQLKIWVNKWFLP
ncbi:MAG TPA: peptidoglycan bridge formation glycyltransferase FemA/FemB family protein [Candidatus Paceibacterota bacterium]|nr:peptidoglycan bridge formation glycyltransferase FemA/FemB family protein [Candidatus Paceibacterota bacterium]